MGLLFQLTLSTNLIFAHFYRIKTLFNLKDVNIFHIIDQINGFGFPGESLYITLTVPIKPFLF